MYMTIFFYFSIHGIFPLKGVIYRGISEEGTEGAKKSISINFEWPFMIKRVVAVKRFWYLIELIWIIFFILANWPPTAALARPSGMKMT